MLRHCNLPLNIFTDFRGHNMAKYTKQQAISIITDCAVKYKENLDGYQLLFRDCEKKSVNKILL